MLKSNIKKKMGYFTASGVAVLQGGEAVLFKVFAFLILGFIVNTPYFGAAVLAGKEILAVIGALLIFGYKPFLGIIKKVKTKRFFYFAIASIGTTFGNLFYILSVIYAGSSYGVILTSLYPIFSMILVKIFMKEKENWKVWLGAGITVVSGLLFSLLPAIFSKSGKFDFKLFIGMLIGGFSALLWAFEGLYLKKGMSIKEKNTEFNDKEILITRGFFAALITFIFIMPITMAFGNSFKYFGMLFTHWKWFLILLAIVVNIIILRILHIFSIKTIGPKITAIIDTNNFLIPSVFALILSFLPKGLDGIIVYDQIIWWSWLLVIPIIIGVTMVIYFHDNNENIDTLEKPTNI